MKWYQVNFICNETMFKLPIAKSIILNLVAWCNAHLSHSFCWSWSGHGLAGSLTSLQLRALSEDWLQEDMLKNSCGYCKISLPCRLFDREPRFLLAIGQRLSLTPGHVLLRQLTAWPLLKASKRTSAGRMRNNTTSRNHIHFCHILLTRSKLQVPSTLKWKSTKGL